mmetsp:Transcript_63863/g.160977  ORF Transcript_63863/g.160977 Transcript_63863/m.160977 type:complete len:350 (-) Transcript_63863:51-1100(-)
MPRTPWSSPSPGLGSTAQRARSAAAEAHRHRRSHRGLEFVPTPSPPPDRALSVEPASWPPLSGEEAEDVVAMPPFETEGPVIDFSMIRISEAGHQGSTSVSPETSSAHNNEGLTDRLSDCTGFTGRFSDTGSMTGSMISCAFSTAERMPPRCVANLPPAPACFRCPVTQQIMKDPVYLDDGRIIDRANVARLGYRGELRPNDLLREAIIGYFEMKRHLEKQQQEWQEYMAFKDERIARKLQIRQHQELALKLALQKGQRRMQGLKASRPSSCSPSLSTATTQPPSSGTPSPQGAQHDCGAASRRPAELGAKTLFRAGSKPPREDLKAVDAARRQRQQRKSTWSSGKMSP